MTIDDLRRLFSAPLFPKAKQFVLAEAVDFEPEGSLEAGAVLSIYGYPSLIVEKRLEHRNPPRYEFRTRTLLPNSAAQAEFASGRFRPVAA